MMNEVKCYWNVEGQCSEICNGNIFYSALCMEYFDCAIFIQRKDCSGIFPGIKKFHKFLFRCAFDSSEFDIWNCKYNTFVQFIEIFFWSEKSSDFIQKTQTMLFEKESFNVNPVSRALGFLSVFKLSTSEFNWMREFMFFFLLLCFPLPYC